MAQLTNKFAEFKIVMRHAMKTFQKQEKRGNTKFVDQLMSDSVRIHGTVKEVQHLKNQRAMPLT